jgi:hypothetical protein
MEKSFSLKFLVAILIFFVFPFLASAQKVPVAKKHTSENIIQIDLYESYKKAKVFPLSTIAESVEYLPLETNEDCLMGDHLAHIFIGQNEIIVFDYEYCYRFSPEGKFINKIGKKGRGPGEYNRPINISLETTNQSIYFLDGRRLLKYNYSGEFIKEFDLGVTSMNFLNYQKGVFLIDDMYYQFAAPKERFSFRFFSELEEMQIAKVDCPKKDKIPFTISHPVMYHFNQNTFLKDEWDNMVYKIEDTVNLFAHISINTGKLKLREKDDNSVFTGKENPGEEFVIDITYMSESGRYVFMLANKGMFFYDKILAETYCCEFKQTGEKWYNFENDVTGGPTFNTSFPFHAVNNNTFVTYNHAYEFFEDGVDLSNPKIKKLLQNLQPDDNPVLVLVKLKE